MKSIVSTFRLSVSRLFKRDNNTLLGRWNLKHNSKSECITVNNANMDHCGDTLCGTPESFAKSTNFTLRK
jgi:hypothetical protein